MSISEGVIGRAERLPVTGLHRRVMIILGFGTFFDAFDTLAIASALTVIFSSLHIDFVATGLLIGVGYVGQLIGALLFGVLSEVWGRRKSFILALSVMGLFSIGAALAWNMQSLALSRALLGIGLGGEAPIAGTMIAELLQRHRRGRYFLLYQTLYQWGILLTPLAGYFFISTLGPETGWRVLFAVGAVPLLLALVSLWWLPESVRWLVEKGRTREADAIVTRFEQNAAAEGLTLDTPRMTAPPDTKATKFAELFHPDYRRRTALCWSHWFLCYYVVVGLVTWLPGLFVRVGHLSVTQSLLAAFGVNVITVVMGYVSASLIDRLGRKRLFSIGFLGMAVGALLGLAEIAWLDVASVFVRVTPARPHQLELTLHHVKPSRVTESLKVYLGNELLCGSLVAGDNDVTLKAEISARQTRAFEGRLWLRIRYDDPSGGDGWPSFSRLAIKPIAGKNLLHALVSGLCRSRLLARAKPYALDS